VRFSSSSKLSGFSAKSFRQSQRSADNNDNIPRATAKLRSKRNSYPMKGLFFLLEKRGGFAFMGFPKKDQSLIKTRSLMHTRQLHCMITTHSD